MSHLSNFGSPNFALPPHSTDVHNLAPSLGNRSALSRARTSLGHSYQSDGISSTSFNRNDLHKLSSRLQSILLEHDATNLHSTKHSLSPLDSAKHLSNSLISVFTSFSSILTSWCADASTLAKLSISVLTILSQSLTRESSLKKQRLDDHTRTLNQLKSDHKDQVSQLSEEISKTNQRAKHFITQTRDEFKSRESKMIKQLEVESQKNSDLRIAVANFNKIFKKLKQEHIEFKITTANDLHQLQLLKQKVGYLQSELDDERVKNLKHSKSQSLISSQSMSSIVSDEVASPTVEHVCERCQFYDTALNKGVSDLGLKLTELETALKLLGFEIADAKLVDWDWRELGELVGRILRVEKLIKDNISCEGVSNIGNISDILKENKKLLRQSVGDSNTIKMYETESFRLKERIRELEDIVVKESNKKQENRQNFDLIKIDADVDVSDHKQSSINHFSRHFLFLPFFCMADRTDETSSFTVSGIQILFRRTLNFYIKTVAHSWHVNAFYRPKSNLINDPIDFDPCDGNRSTLFHLPRFSELCSISNGISLQKAIVSAINLKSFSSDPSQQSALSELKLFLSFLKEEYPLDVLLFLIKFIEYFYPGLYLNLDILPPMVDSQSVSHSKIRDLFDCIDETTYESFFHKNFWKNSKYPLFLLFENVITFYLKYQQSYIRQFKKEIDNFLIDLGSRHVCFSQFVKFLRTRYLYLNFSDITLFHRFYVLFSPSTSDPRQENSLDFSPFITTILYFGFPCIELFSRFSKIHPSIIPYRVLTSSIKRVCNVIFPCIDYDAREKRSFKESSEVS
ncbi:hypothetical protein GEMRC1_008817 [Eukaryota sp. GEM-RC1]